MSWGMFEHLVKLLSQTNTRYNKPQVVRTSVMMMIIRMKTVNYKQQLETYKTHKSCFRTCKCLFKFEVESSPVDITYTSPWCCVLMGMRTHKWRRSFSCRGHALGHSSHDGHVARGSGNLLTCRKVPHCHVVPASCRTLDLKHVILLSVTD